jgi:sulfur carrier protein ThiS
MLRAVMVTVLFAPHLQRHVPCPPQRVSATTLREALEAALLAAPALRHYVFDEQNHIRKHVAVFVNGILIRNRINLDVALNQGDKIDVIQALSGG